MEEDAVKRGISPAIKLQWKAEVYAACRASGHPDTCDCKSLTSCVTRHGDFGFSTEMFCHAIEDIILEDRGPLDRYLADPWRVWREGRGLYIWGVDIGIGKTTLAHLVVRHLYRWLFLSGSPNHAASSTFPFSDFASAMLDGYRGWYMLSGDMADRAHWKGRDGFVEDFYDWYTEEEKKVDVFTSAMLVIDELGRENRDSKQRTEAGREMLEQMLRERQNARAITILVGHDSPDLIVSRYGRHIESLMARMTIVQVSIRNRDRRRSLQGAR